MSKYYKHTFYCFASIIFIFFKFMCVLRVREAKINATLTKQKQSIIESVQFQLEMCQVQVCLPLLLISTCLGNKYKIQ